MAGNPYHDKMGRFTSGTYGGGGSRGKGGGTSSKATGHNAGGGDRKVANHIKMQHAIARKDMIDTADSQGPVKDKAWAMGERTLKTHFPRKRFTKVKYPLK